MAKKVKVAERKKEKKGKRSRRRAKSGKWKGGEDGKLQGPKILRIQKWNHCYLRIWKGELETGAENEEGREGKIDTSVTWHFRARVTRDFFWNYFKKGAGKHSCHLYAEKIQTWYFYPRVKNETGTDFHAWIVSPSVYPFHFPKRRRKKPVVHSRSSPHPALRVKFFFSWNSAVFTPPENWAWSPEKQEIVLIGNTQSNARRKQVFFWQKKSWRISSRYTR